MTESAASRQKAEFKLSARKDAFLTSQNFIPVQLAPSDLHALAEHYLNKHGIKIIINGQTEYGREKIAAFENYVQAHIVDLKDESKKHATYFYDVMQQRRLEIFRMNFKEHLDEIKQAFGDLLISDGYLPSEALTEEEFKRLNTAASRLSCQKEINAGIAREIENLTKGFQDACLKKSDCAIEIAHIQQSLSPSESVGYVFTNYHRVGKSHVEVFILQRDKIIKPVRWREMLRGVNISLGVADLKEVYDTPVKPPMVVSTGSMPITPQIGRVECASLGFLILKELLKNNAKQLSELTLSYCVYDSEDHLSHCFIPSPQTLRYSQWSSYNEIIAAMLMNNTSGGLIAVPHKRHTCSVITLADQLQRSIKIANARGDTVVAKMNQALLERLPVFSEAWLSEWLSAKQKHRAMNHSGNNQYLIYHSQRFFALSQAMARDKEKAKEKEEATSAVGSGNKVHPEGVEIQKPMGGCCIVS